MCRPEHFTVSYRINPWMHPEDPTDTGLAVRQWETLYADLPRARLRGPADRPDRGLPDMVYAANGGFVLDGIAYGARFAYPERQPEGPAYMDWFRANGFDVREPGARSTRARATSCSSATRILAGTGFRTAVDSHDELARDLRPRGRHAAAGRPELLPPRHRARRARLRSADHATSPTCRGRSTSARSSDPRRALPRRDPRHRRGRRGARAQLASATATTSSSPRRAKGFERQLRERGYNPIGVDLSELLLGGGGVKCCTLELRR